MIASLQIGQNKIELYRKKVFTDIEITSSISLGTTRYDLKNYLPDDDYVYECDFVYIYACQNTIVSTGICSDLENFHSTGAVHDGNIDDQGQVILLVGKGRYIETILDRVSGSGTPRISTIYLKGYKRLYKDNSNE